MSKNSIENDIVSDEEIVDTESTTDPIEEEADDLYELLKDVIEDEDEDDEDDDGMPNAPITSCHQFTKILYGLMSNDWEIDLRSIDQNIIHISKDDERFILYLFSGDSKSNVWLSDEEMFNNELPLWFSEISHTVSPIYRVKSYAERIGFHNISDHRPIVIMLSKNHIINAPDAIDTWYNVLLLSVDRFCGLIETEDDLDDIENDADDVGTEHKIDDGDDLYKAVIPKEYLKHQDPSLDLSNAKESNIDEKPKRSDDGIDIDSENFHEIKITRVRFGVERSGESGEIAPPSLSTYFRQCKRGDNFIAWIDIEGKPMLNAEYQIEIRDEENRLIVSDVISFYSTMTKTTYLALPTTPAGDYSFYIRHNSRTLYSQEITFVDVESGYDKYITAEGFGLYRIEGGDTAGDQMTMMQRGAMSCYNYEGLAGVLVTPLFKNISGRELTYQFILQIENEQGKVIYESEDSGELDIDEEYVFAREVRGVVCPTGNYTIIVKFLDETLIMTDFVVGRRDVTTLFKVDQLTARYAKNNAMKRKDTDPMKELDSMIGLDSLKKQLHKTIAKIQMDQLRKTQGLPIKKQQLHMAFLGNPGTGKTTVAKLLGEIYKNIGVLSKGHVVLEDRSTLMTQNWGGEGEMVNKALEKAQGGILFIDEAYDLVTDNKSDPGKLVISALLQAMSDEDNRDFMIIFAGYTQPMEQMLSKNPGLRSRCASMYFSDYKVPELMQIADLWLGKNCYNLTPDARKYFESIVASAYASRNEHFGNARYVVNLLENEVQPAMAERVMAQETFMAPLSLLTTIEACDIPNYNAERGGAAEAIAQLDSMIGLGGLKQQIRSYLSYIRFVQARRDNKIDTPIPPLHMVFTGNPGTGKTSVAEYLGDIYRSMGVLSVGNVIKVTRADMIDKYIGGTEDKMKNLLTAAHGNILFIDEAYTLFSKGDNDYGKNAIEVLLDTLGKENPDMIVILAGYPKEMEELLNINPGIKGRFPHTFHFEDYTEDELFEIAQGVVDRNSLKLTDGAASALRAIIRKECKIKDSNFSNARFVVRLITTQVLPNMAIRLEGETDPEKLKRIHQRDIPIEHKEIRMINENLFDEDLIESALERLDAMVGLTKVKIAIHQFVDFARVINRKDPTQIERYPLKWSFVGNTGTGKSSVATILSEILKAMHLLGKGHTIEVKADELYGVATYKADELMLKRMKESLQGLLFVDGDAPQQNMVSNLTFNPDYLRACLAINTAEIHGRFAVVIAEQHSSKVGLAKSLNKIGISNFDHTLIFDDYTAEELMAILSSQLKRDDLEFTPDAATIMYSYITRLCNSNSTIEVNARTVSELANSIRDIVSANGCDKKSISADVVAKFATLQPPHARVGY